MKKEVCFIDMDGVIADFNKAIHAIRPDLHLPTISQDVEDACIANPSIFHDLEPIKDSIRYVKKLFPLYDVYFLSTPMWNVPLSFTGKRIWIDTYFGKDAEKRLILSHRKDLCVGRFLVDDSLHNGVTDFKGEHIHFGTDKFPNWDETFEYLDRQAKR
jgi:5'(3')-deoxyribonucleotidase